MPGAQKTVLIVDDDEGMRDTLAAILRGDYRVFSVGSAEAALDLLPHERVELVIADVRLPGIDGLELLRIVKEQQPLVEVIVISAVSEVETAVQAMKQGAYHYITKDFEYDALRSLVANAAERQDLNRRVLALSAQVDEQTDRELVTGTSPAMQGVVSAVSKVARVPATVLILGESGTGKEMVARWIHRQSAHADGPFLAVNLAAIPSELVESTLFGHEKGAFTGATRQQLGKFELAAGGTLFLDEIGDLRLELQAKLLRAIQEGEIERVGGHRGVRTDFRLICATNQDLERAVREGRFRDDLYYRINVVPIEIPPLRERPEDIPPLLDHFLQRFAVRYRKRQPSLSDSALTALQQYRWPGNVRELQNVIERLVAMHEGPTIEEDDLPLEYRGAGAARGASTLEQAVTGFERAFILRALEQAEGNVSATARALGVPLSTLKHRMARLEVREVARKLRPPTPPTRMTS
ncbi:MAG: sigma-54 dependent transcriptional regulator [Vicinamibacterales bacterium]|nr:sigma-54 dependent transcriptional regulator [Vicinamibacterales bacterium]